MAMTPRWSIQDADEAEVRKIAEEFSLPFSIAKVLFLRGVKSSASVQKFLNRSLQDLTHPLELSGMKEAAERVAVALEQKQGILIHGDFDADGITSTAILAIFFRDVGANVFSYIPNRLYEGHGISMKALDLAKKQDLKVMITCDCGSSNAKEIEIFAQAGIDTIITDHHYVGDSGSTNAILVNPRAEEEESGHEGLAGVGVAFMLMAAIRSVLRDKNYFQTKKEPNLKEYLDIVALGTVADMAPLMGQNRILVSEGLGQLVVSRRPGILAMKNKVGLKETAVETNDIGFKLAPRINAAARLGHADEALELLTCVDPQRAQTLANKLEQWNAERKAISERMLHISMSQAEQQVKEGRTCVVISSSEFHSGISGLVAQKLAEQFYRPVFLFAVEGEVAKASARSRNGIHLHQVLEKCASLLTHFGGHEEAGGCVMPTKNLPEFKKTVEEVVSTMTQRQKAIMIDAQVALEEVDEAFLETLNKLRPFGMGNPEPLFTSRARIAGAPKLVGDKHLKATVVASDGRPFGTIGFGLWNETNASLQKDVEMVFSLEENTWQGRTSIQLNLKAIRAI